MFLRGQESQKGILGKNGLNKYFSLSELSFFYSFSIYVFICIISLSKCSSL